MAHVAFQSWKLHQRSASQVQRPKGVPELVGSRVVNVGQREFMRPFFCEVIVRGHCKFQANFGGYLY